MRLHIASPTKLNKAFLAGLCGGLAGTLVMTQFQNGWSKAAAALSSKDDSREQASKQPAESDNATMKVAGALAHLTGRQLSFEQRKKAGLAVHYAFGTLMGGVYGIVEEASPRQVRRHAALSGVGLGSTLFVGADEIAVSKLGLSGGSAPLSSHVYALASHLIYGITTALTYATLRHKL
jgi:putative membrane protein